MAGQYSLQAAQGHRMPEREIGRYVRVSVLHGEELPRAGHAPQFVVGERDARACDEIDDGSRHKNLAGSSG
jgi:hypothetical protein